MNSDEKTITIFIIWCCCSTIIIPFVWKLMKWIENKQFNTFQKLELCKKLTGKEKGLTLENFDKFRSNCYFYEIEKIGGEYINKQKVIAIDLRDHIGEKMENEIK